MRGKPVQLRLPTARSVIAAGAFVSDMKRALRRLVDDSGMSRPQFVDAMNDYARMADREGKGPLISLATLDKLLSDEARGQLPTLWVFEVMLNVAGNMSAMEAWLQIHGCGLMDETARMKVELAEIELERTAKRERRKMLKNRLLEEL